jgi:hypothetical protein
MMTASPATLRLREGQSTGRSLREIRLGLTVRFPLWRAATD